MEEKVKKRLVSFKLCESSSVLTHTEDIKDPELRLERTKREFLGIDSSLRGYRLLDVPFDKYSYRYCDGS